MNVLAYIATHWVPGDPTADPESDEFANHIQLADDYDLLSYSNITGADNLIPDPNIVVVVAVMSEAVYLAIVADPNYEVLANDDGI